MGDQPAAGGALASAGVSGVRAGVSSGLWNREMPVFTAFPCRLRILFPANPPLVGQLRRLTRRFEGAEPPWATPQGDLRPPALGRGARLGASTLACGTLDADGRLVNALSSVPGATAQDPADSRPRRQAQASRARRHARAVQQPDPAYAQLPSHIPGRVRAAVAHRSSN